MRTQLSLPAIGALLEGRHQNPFEVLGPHEVSEGGARMLAVRALLPDCKQAWVVHGSHAVPRPMRRIHPAGVYEALCPWPESESQTYQLRISDERGDMTTMHDPYCFPPLLTEFDLYLFGQGTHTDAYERMGAQLRTVDGVAGVNFAVWAPNAQGVSVVGDFNHWDGRRHPMRKLVPSGIWELFLPGLGPGEKYKYRIRTESGAHIDKADPYAFAAELPPFTASIVADLKGYAWRDQEWLARRQATNWLERPVAIYEVHLGSWRRSHDRRHGWLSYRDLAPKLAQYCNQMGYTHVELLPVSEHPYTGSWGYQTTGYFAPTSRYGSPEDFMFFVDYLHQHGLGVIIDWVPAHFPRDDHGLRRFDGTALFEHADPRQGEHPDWGTLIFNYGRNEVRNFLISNAAFWIDKYHIDGLRVDAVASMLYLDYSRKEGEWVPNDYGGRENLGAISLLKDTNCHLHGKWPGVLTIAEESTAWGGVSHPVFAGGLGFSFKWNMGWMNDTLRYMRRDSIHRKHHHNELTFSLIYAYSENFVLPFSHDEVVHGKRSLLSQMPGDLWQKFANLRLLFTYQWTHPGKKLVFMGSDIGQWDEWNHDAELQWNLLQWDTHGGLQRTVADLNRMLQREPALYEQDHHGNGFEWIDCHNWQESALSFLRRGKDPQDYLVVVVNFTPVPRHNFHLGVPDGVWHREIFNSDAGIYGGSNVGNHPGVSAEPAPTHGRPHRLRITLPPLAAVVFKPERTPPKA